MLARADGDQCQAGAVGHRPPGEVLDAAGLATAAIAHVGRGDRVWLASTDDRAVVLRRCQGDAAIWLHPLLSAVAAAFPVPEPLRLFAGSSVLATASGCWEALTMLPGHPIGFDQQPPMQEIGAFLATFHLAAADRTPATGPRPGGLPLCHLAQLVDWQGAHRTMGSAEGVAVLAGVVYRFTVDLDQVGYTNLPTCLVHGDPTSFNVLADDDPLRPSGIIDFELADIEAPVADIAFCLWRSGRPSQLAKTLDLVKVRDFVGGYRSVRPLTDQELAAIAVCLRGRGLQMLAKRTQVAVPDHGPLAELLWLETHQLELLDAASGA